MGRGGGVHPCRSSGRRPPTMVGRPRKGSWPGHKFLPEGKTLANFGSPGRMDTDQFQAPLRRGNHINPSLHNIPPRGVPLAIFFQCRAKNSPIGGNPWQNFRLPGRISTNLTDYSRENIRPAGILQPLRRRRSRYNIFVSIFGIGRKFSLSKR